MTDHNHSEDGGTSKRRELDDEGLESGDDGGQRDPLEDDYAHDDDEHGETREENVEDIRLPRHPIPRPSDGEVKPSFLLPMLLYPLDSCHSYIFYICPTSSPSSQSRSIIVPSNRP